MKLPLPEVSNLIILLALFSLLNISEALPVPEGISGNKPDIHRTVHLVQKVYGPWSDVRKLYADYNDYWTGVQDFQPSSEDVPIDEGEVAESGPADFQSNYGEGEGDEFESDVPFLPSAYDPSTSDQADDQAAGGDPENHDLEGNVQWTSSVV